MSEHRDSIPEGAGAAGQPSHILHRRCAYPTQYLRSDGGDGGTPMAKKDDAVSKRLAEEIAVAKRIKENPPSPGLLDLATPDQLDELVARFNQFERI